MPSSPADKIVFDLDDTLYLERDFAFSGFEAVGQHVLTRHGVGGFAEICRDLFDTAHRQAVFGEALRHCRLSASQDIGELIEIYRYHSPQIALCDDTTRYLSGKGAIFGLITDGPEKMQRNKIAALGLQASCDQIIPTGRWGHGFGKPHPRAYEIISGASAGRRYVYVADNAAKDFVTPKRMGWATIQILRTDRVHSGAAPDPEHQADRVITSLDQLDEALESI
ncbi:HAD family hydrolase [Paracoccus aerodenitrificans]|uniref:HAD family hydrolase n=1 Tax=Paracoccus aerodenitrificans TaxID=3017781 RepID=UPI0022F139D9|nr:HAD family hydrolase [Paracoccus aerodenitrificans]WBU63467.1 HAD family hydrolase [Paracoccus aerodenitrificans]